jgi:hypothetical protein
MASNVLFERLITSFSMLPKSKPTLHPFELPYILANIVSPNGHTSNATIESLITTVAFTNGSETTGGGAYHC